MQTKINLELLNVLKRYNLFGYDYIDEPKIKEINNFNLSLPNNLDDLEQYIKHCHLCPLSNQNKKLDLGIGNPTSQIYIIGTNNYKSTDVFQLFLDMISNYLLLDKKDYYLLDILKCDSTNYKLDLKVSKNICSEFLKKQIELSNAKLIITIGDSFNYLMNLEEDIFSISGNIYSYNNITTVPLFDFEYLYKNPLVKNKMINDLNKIKNRLGDVNE